MEDSVENFLKSVVEKHFVTCYLKNIDLTEAEFQEVKNDDVEERDIFLGYVYPTAIPTPGNNFTACKVILPTKHSMAAAAMSAFKKHPDISFMLIKNKKTDLCVEFKLTHGHLLSVSRHVHDD